MMSKKLVVLILSLTSCALAFAQEPGKAELEQERKRLQQEMQEIQKMYDDAKGQTKQSLGQLNMITRKINLQEKYISNINKELRYIDDDIYLSNLEIYRLQKQLDTLKAEYAKTIVYAYKNRSSYDYVNFIFSANSFNDAIRRVAYLKSYRAYREKQVKIINETRDLIARRQQQQIERKDQKSETLKAQTSEREELAKQKKEKDAVVSKLRANEKDIQRELALKKKKDRDIQNAIQAIVRREIEAAKKKEADRLAAEKKEADRLAAERKKTEAANPGTVTPAPKEEVAATRPASKPTSYLEMNATDVKLGADFASSKGKLPWPLDKHVVLVPFGKYEVDGFKGIVGNNSGLTLGTVLGSSAKSVFDGEVVGIHNYGDGAAVVVRHGKYITTYSNLSSVNVAKGARVKTGQVIGKVGPDDTGSGGKLDFMLMIESNVVNPAAWLR
ncbi:MAG TPA: peptidoglycan DD-metalloendopeptidase family protein [Chitinophagaceae bacterium]|nr:peptidoglycan DD-metalloendopeptidase family protein [Chitinophagaceae bacterium]